MKAKYLIILCIISFSLGCSKGRQDEVVRVEHYIDSRLQVYFDSFKAEAEKRDIKVDFESLEVDGYIRQIRESGVAGQCQSFEDGSRTVIISTSYWRTATDIEKEFLIFHELGHCVLDREHYDEADLNGDCLSMMNSGGSVCNINYRAATREYYLDELFTN